MTTADNLETFQRLTFERLSRVYPENKVKVLLNQLISEVRKISLSPAAEPICRLWTEKDVILISYGDSICMQGQFPLQGLCSFLEQNLKG